MLQGLRSIEKALTALGHQAFMFLHETGAIAQFLVRVVLLGSKPPYRTGRIIEQMEIVGVGSLFIIVLTGSFTGAVMTLQSIAALELVGMQNLVGSSVMLAVTRELGPVLTSLMVTGRVGSAMATELGTMRVSEQIDAMEVMAVDPLRFLVVPRVVAASLMVPALHIIFVLVAGIGSYAVAVGMLGLDEGAYFARIEWFVDSYDIIHGLVKALVFGVTIAVVGCYKGFHASGGARGVGLATTQAVVTGSIAIFVLDYILTSILLVWAPY